MDGSQQRHQPPPTANPTAPGRATGAQRHHPHCPIPCWGIPWRGLGEASRGCPGPQRAARARAPKTGTPQTLRKRTQPASVSAGLAVPPASCLLLTQQRADEVLLHGPQPFQQFRLVRLVDLSGEGDGQRPLAIRGGCDQLRVAGKLPVWPYTTPQRVVYRKMARPALFVPGPAGSDAPSTHFSC